MAGAENTKSARRFPPLEFERFDSAHFLSYTSVFVRDAFLPEWGGSRWFGVVELEGNYLRSRNKVRRNGTEERPEWGASPAKPSKPLRTESKGLVLLLGVRTEFLAGGISGFAVDLSALGLRSRAILSARLAGAAHPRRIHFGCSRDEKLRAIEGRLCRRFHNW